eukprot:TRINITY_DN14774_c0_g1_i1.p1 TRINITY_DN14774_c0_g1~~TRINITY_DN14774_c0_g1_i1.p1  ORF type:complete len:644 (+),score=221.97 TRINITY_DN14774_c0_g1_i1:909-2840(+)
MKLHLVSVCMMVLCCFRTHAATTADMRATIQRLLGVLQKELVTKSVDFRPFPPRWAETQGLYKSYVHLNAVGSESANRLRREFAVPDSNMFVTTFVVTALLEAHQLGTIDLQPHEKAIAMSLQAVASFQDKNRPPNVPSYVFWPQTLVNGTWSAGSPNLVKPLEYLVDVDKFVEEVFKLMNLEKLFEYSEIVQMVVSIFQHSFVIPPDVDDSSCNLALGGTLKSLSATFPTLYSSWEASNKDITALFALEELFSYKPLDPNANSTMDNLIDPRTYYFLSKYLDQLNEQGVLNTTAFPATWLLNIPTEIPFVNEEGMPSNTDNVDLCVLANFLYGTSHAVLQGLNNGSARSYFESDTNFQNLYTSAANVVSWGITSGAAATRPDIGLLYYPSLYDFMWMVARTSFLFRQFESALPPAMANAAVELSNAMRTAGTDLLVGLAESDGIHGTWWDDFLGDAEDPPQGEDRLFSTAVAVNAFISTWAQPTGQADCPITWSPDTPDTVHKLVASATEFLNNQTLDGSMQLLPMNAFFSGSVKTNTTIPYAYPGTYSYYLNGTYLDPHNPSNIFLEDGVWAVQGYIQPDQYEAMLQETWFNLKVPLDFPGFNVGIEGGYPFWSSPAMTYSLSLLALSQYVVLEECPSNVV